MAGMDDLNVEELIDSALGMGDGDDTKKFEAKKLFQPTQRKGLKTPVLSGADMASASSGGVPMSEDETVEGLDETARMNADHLRENTGGQMSFDLIYGRSGLPGADSFTVFRLEQLFDDEELAELDDRARVAAVRAILKSHDVELDQIVDDAVARRQALESHDTRLKSNISRVEEEIGKENTRLQSEIEEYASPRITKMEANNERLERLRRDYRDWFNRKQEEQSRIVTILEPWGGDERLRLTEKVDAVEEAGVATVPNPAVSTDDVFEPQTTPQQAVASDSEWKLGEEDSDPEPTQPRREPSVKTELPSEFRAAEAIDSSVTMDFDFGARARFPRTPLQGFVAALAILLWIFAGLLLTAQLVSEMVAAAAIGVALGLPLAAALVVSLATRSSGKWATGFFAVLLYASVGAFFAAHYDPGKLVQGLTHRPLLFVDELGLNSQTERTVHQLTAPYAQLIAGPLGASAELPVEPAPTSAGEGGNAGEAGAQ